jgi:hypothetical protein
MSSRADQTNLVQSLGIRLRGISQGDTKTNKNVVTTGLNMVRVGDAEVIAALAGAMGKTFTSQAQLFMISPLPSGTPSIVIRDGTSSVDVSAFFIYEVKSAVVTSSDSNLRTGRMNTANYSVQHLALIDADGATLNLHFDVQGITVETFSSGPNSNPQAQLNSNVSGSGDDAGKTVLFEGSFSLRGYTLEVVNNNPPNA